MRLLVCITVLLIFVSGCGHDHNPKPPEPPPTGPGSGTGDELWSVAQVGDIHSPAFTLSEIATNLVPFILAHTNDGVFNIRAFISTGDLYEQDTNVVHTPPEAGWPVAAMQADLERLRNNGILTVLANGNHDCDVTNSPSTCAYCNGTASNDQMLWNSIFPISFFSNQVGFIETKVPGDSHNLVMSYTNGVKLLFITYKTVLLNCDPTNDYRPQTEWITNVAARYPDHNVMVLAHFFLNGRTLQPAFVDGPGLTRIGPGAEPFMHGFLDVSNLLFCVGGHDRFLRKGHGQVPANDGHSIDVIGFNTQGASPRVSQYINLFTFRPKLGTVTISTYDYIENRLLTNNDAALLNNLGQGQQHNWEVPLLVH